MSSRSSHSQGGGASQQKQITQQEMRAFLENPNERKNWAPFIHYMKPESNTVMNEKMMKSLYKVLEKNPTLINTLLLDFDQKKQQKTKSRIINGARFNVCFFDVNYPQRQLSDILIEELLKSSYHSNALSLLKLMKDYGSIKSSLLDDAIQQRREIEEGVITPRDVLNFLRHPNHQGVIQKLAKFIPTTGKFRGDLTFLGIKMYEPLHTVLTDDPTLINVILDALKYENDGSPRYDILQTMMYILTQYSHDDDHVQYLKKVVLYVFKKLKREKVEDTKNPVYRFLHDTLNQHNSDALLVEALTTPVIDAIKTKLRNIEYYGKFIKKQRTRLPISLSNVSQYLQSSSRSRRPF